ncbi:histidine kinase dimerization/phosphoacceptor domain -containing protein [Desulfonatronum sp. SC1]|uniref:histidine kinase dimerization/phosphoacceptor domain -containing protein n=1 Tax=Desulfonatronum sp. SC1 TaxID=2109626 RepID=UPI000D31E26B|nr:sensor histidine kinase [Desulfonatronum sp. SC1]PTN37168.1 hypothetical protein C6366_07195 [Desulfonatronum sp. SC1]
MLRADSDTNAVLQDLGGGIKSIALVPERLYRYENLSRIDFQGYLETLLNDLCLALAPSRNISRVAQAHGVELGLGIAVPYGLIANELATNALKYAFPGDKTHSGLSSSEIRAGQARCLAHPGHFSLTYRRRGRKIQEFPHRHKID